MMNTAQGCVIVNELLPVSETMDNE